MPKIDAKTLRVPITISGYEFTCPQPYQAGHSLSEGEAEALNTLFADRIRTNCARAVKDLSDNSGLDSDDRYYNMQMAVNEYAASYTFASRSDPIRRKAIELAKTAILAQAALDNLDLSPASVASKAEAVIASGKYPQFLETARKFIELQREVANEELGK